MRAWTLCGFVAASCTSVAAVAEPPSHVWLIGGGPDSATSQSQIEDNVRWVEELLLARDLDVRTYFGLGEHPGVDVAYWDPPAEAASPLEPLARVYGEALDPGLAFRRHRLQRVRGSTIKSELVPALRSEFERLGAEDSALLIFNGHGGYEAGDVTGNHMRLWGDETLDVRELDAIFDRAADGATVRFVMTQCYSGAFERLMYEDPGRKERLEGGRCGFFSESAHRQAEGCALVVDEAHFRDYTTYFFAALSGETRDGHPIPEAHTDRDGDGRVSFREAHLYMLETAESADLPRSTSEAYLTDWTPWYLRWDASIDGRESAYWELANEVARRYDWRPASSVLETERRRLVSMREAHHEQRDRSRDRVSELQTQLRASLQTRWPELAHPYAPAHGRLLDTESAAIAGHIRDDPRYAELLAQQRSAREASRGMLDAERRITQIDKIYRLRNLARLETALGRYGSETEQREYAELLECERGHLESDTQGG